MKPIVHQGLPQNANVLVTAILSEVGIWISGESLVIDEILAQFLIGRRIFVGSHVRWRWNALTIESCHGDTLLVEVGIIVLMNLVRAHVSALEEGRRVSSSLILDFSPIW